MNYKKRQAFDAFMEDLRAMERKHNMRLVIDTSAIRFHIVPLVPEVSKAARRAVEKLTGTHVPWYKRLFSQIESKHNDAST